jgi:uncharacterized protein
MSVSRKTFGILLAGVVAWATLPTFGRSEELRGTIEGVDANAGTLEIKGDPTEKAVVIRVGRATPIKQGDEERKLANLTPGSRVVVNHDKGVASAMNVEPASATPRSILGEFWYNFRHNLFKPLLLFFYMGFLFPILKVKFEFPYVIYQGLTIFLLIAIGWHGGEELAHMPLKTLGGALGFMLVGFVLNFFIGLLAYLALNALKGLRRIDKATVAGYYGSDSAGTFVTCLGVLASAHIAYNSYMPVMLAIMEVPGCLVALYLVSRLRHHGMDALGNMPDEPGYDPTAKPILPALDEHGHPKPAESVEMEEEMALEKVVHEHEANGKAGTFMSLQLLHEVFLNPGLVLLFGGIIVGYISGLQGPEVTRADDNFFVTLFQGVLCLFLLEMGMTASRRLRDLRTAGPGFVAFGLIAPNVFATLGIIVAHVYSMVTGTPFALGTYVLFAVLCGAASYIAVPAVQRLAIPEASPTLPLAASLGLTFSYNVTIGIPVYIEIAKLLMRTFPA